MYAVSYQLDTAYTTQSQVINKGEKGGTRLS